jgi:hypothetical protein
MDQLEDGVKGGGGDFGGGGSGCVDDDGNECIPSDDAPKQEEGMLEKSDDEYHCQN